MSTEAFLKKLDKDELDYVISKANQLLNEKRKEEKYPMWIVSDHDCNLGWFKSDDYVKAAEFLLGEAQENAYAVDGQLRSKPSQDMELHLNLVFIPMSEYKDWFID